MVKNAKLLEKFEKRQLKKNRFSLDKKYKILNAMYAEVTSLRILKNRKNQEKSKVIYKIAKVINSV